MPKKTHNLLKLILSPFEHNLHLILLITSSRFIVRNDNI